MLANNNSRSTNNDPVESSESLPITGAAGNGSSSRIIRQFGSLFQSTTPGALSDPARYVEFGSISDTEANAGRTLGTFAGVFCPVALSMFSALVFIRVGFIVGNAGLYVTLLQFVIAYVILLFTVSSVCAISTNGAVEGGGVYFMISRTLGLEFGGSIGTLFFLANVVGCGLAISGCAEGIIQNFGPSEGHDTGSIPDGRWWRFLYCTMINTLMLLVVLIGAEMFAKTSMMILGVVVVCLLSTYISFLAKGSIEVAIPVENNLVQNATYKVIGNYTGLNMTTLKENLYSQYGQDYTSDGNVVNFAVVFGVLFSGVTGIMAGANMSGELKNPSRSIPAGTLSAVLFTFLCYIGLSVLMALTTSRFLLQNNFLFLGPVNLWPTFVTIGILTATFSTGLSNLIGSSRVLEALAKDKVFGSLLNFVVRGTYKSNPIAAVIGSWILVEAILLIGSLNTIAQINSVLFMLAYLATNLACLGIEITGAPNFRPTYKYFTWHTAFIGLVGTAVMMFVINPIYASSSVILCLLLVIALHLFSPASQGAQWGSISQALMFHQVRKYLLMLDSRKDHVKFWRPQMLLLVSSPRSCCPLIHFVNDMKKGGLYVIGHVKVGEFSEIDSSNDPTIEEYTQWLSLIDHMKVKAFVELTLSRSVREGIQHLIRISGMGAMKPNTIILGFYDEELSKDFFEHENSPYKTSEFDGDGKKLFPYRHNGEQKQLLATDYVQIIDDVLRMKKNICLCRHFHKLDKQLIARSNHIRYIDVWPVNLFEPKNEDPFDVVSLFMMQLSCIINMLPVWKKLELRVFLCESETPSESSTFQLNSTSMERPAEYRLGQQLKSLRISASIHQISEWNKDMDFPRHRNILKQFTSKSDDHQTMTEENINRSKLYMQRINQTIRDKSNATAVTFMYLPAPPKLSTIDYKEKSHHYLDLLTELTYDLPPTILVHGINAVTSTTL
ncbi:solute carrier family 12 member 9 [Sabethes cyaneus]|uniref:solute carrier family 12 member 9 n=1 Tax=Sabethes cyaneus TaxID=53552 RepID=UPI00221E2C66|nr:solute carrier family 12 member 9 [Sabethes cyaneus]XP_053693102.1 solute carrier family 12 member 9 [Sabethes cyaneus]